MSSADDEIDVGQLHESFVSESQEDLATVEDALLRLDKSPSNRSDLALVFRKFHTLKGNALALGFERLGDLAHRTEDLLERLRRGEEAVTPAVVSHLLGLVDGLRSLIPATVTGQANADALAEELGRVIAARGSSPGAPIDEGSQEAELALDASRGLRIDLRKLDLLLSVTSEIAIARGRLGLLVAAQEAPDLAASYRLMEQLLDGLHHLVSSVRMVPIGPLLRRYQRVVRDLALEQRKQVELTVSDHGVEVDTSILEHIKAPLTQMIRNAIYHGIEAPARRKRAGKPALGRIELRVRHDADGIVIEVEDDGAGLDRARILERARALGLVAESAAPSEQAIDRLIFCQGLSTAKSLSNASGRGVGMDIVLRNLDALGGAVEVTSRPGSGTLFSIRMPLTLAIIEGLVVRLASEVFVVPLAGVVRCLDLAAVAAPHGSDGVVSYRGQAVPFVRLRCVFGLSADTCDKEVLLLAHQGGEQLGIVVDQLLGKAQVVVRPPGRFFSGLPAISGLTILGDGRVSAIVNVNGLLEWSRQRELAGPSRPEGAHLMAAHA